MDSGHSTKMPWDRQALESALYPVQLGRLLECPRGKGTFMLLKPPLQDPWICDHDIAGADPRKLCSPRTGPWVWPNRNIPTLPPPWAGMPSSPPTCAQNHLLLTHPPPRTTPAPREFSWHEGSSLPEISGLRYSQHQPEHSHVTRGCLSVLSRQLL